jgi:di/tricarboxylate transporter
MSLAWISVGALVCAVALSCTTTINVGVLSLAFAWIVGVYLGGLPLSDVLAGFPTQLFITLVGVTLLFAMAELNGTLERVTERAVRLCRGHPGVLPIMFFVLAAGLSSVGPGGTATTALLAAPAMAAAHQMGVPIFLMIIMVGNGALAGTLSPFSPTGVVANGVMSRIGLEGAEWWTYFNNLSAHAIVGFGGYAAFGGWRLFTRRGGAAPDGERPTVALAWQHWLTMAGIAGLLLAVAAFDMNVGTVALAAATLLALVRAVDEKEAIQRMPWSVILMVTGVTVLIALMEKTQGIDLFAHLLVRLSTGDSVTAVVAFVTGVVSVYSSTSGVVLPAFLPVVPGLALRLGGVDPLAIASSMNVGASLVDLSPISTAGALCLAAAPEGLDTRALFNRLLAWGLSMTVVGAALCWLMFG